MYTDFVSPARCFSTVAKKIVNFGGCLPTPSRESHRSSAKHFLEPCKAAADPNRVHTHALHIAFTRFGSIRRAFLEEHDLSMAFAQAKQLCHLCGLALLTCGRRHGWHMTCVCKAYKCICKNLLLWKLHYVRLLRRYDCTTFWPRTEA